MSEHECLRCDGGGIVDCECVECGSQHTARCPACGGSGTLRTPVTIDDDAIHDPEWSEQI